MPRHTVAPKRPKKPKSPKSSLEARRLIRAVLRRRQSNSTRQAARVLKLSNHMQLVRMLKGEIRDTPEMKAAIARANARAKKAWAMEKLDERDCIDPATLRPLVHELTRLVRQLQAIAPNGYDHENKSAP